MWEDELCASGGKKQRYSSPILIFLNMYEFYTLNKQDYWKYLWFLKNVSSLGNVVLKVIRTNHAWKWQDKHALFLKFVNPEEREELEQ